MGATTNFMNQMGQYQTPTDPYEAARQTTAGNLYGAQTATAANRVNQVTPYGSLNYQQSGTDQYGNPIYSATQTIAPELQNAFGNLAQGVTESSQSPFDISQYQQKQVGSGPSFTNLGSAEQQQKFNQNPSLQTSLDNQGMSGWDKASSLVMQRLQPQIDRQNKQLDVQLANQGIMPGSEAYNQAKTQLAQSQNDLMNQAQLTGLNAQNQFFGQGLQAGQFGNAAQQQMYQNALSNVNQQNTAAQQNFQNQLASTQFNNQLAQQAYTNQLAQQAANNAALQANYGQGLTAYQLPLSQLSAFRSATAPTYVNPYQQAAVSGADLSTAYAQQQAADIARQNAETARQAAMTGGLFSLGGAALSNPTSVGNIMSGAGSLYNQVKDWWNGL